MSDSHVIGVHIDRNVACLTADSGIALGIGFSGAERASLFAANLIELYDLGPVMDQLAVDGAPAGPALKERFGLAVSLLRAAAEKRNAALKVNKKTKERE